VRVARKRIRLRASISAAPPHWRSILASFVLVLGLMFFFEILANPRSGELRRPGTVVPAFVLFVIAEAGVFYAEHRLRKRRPTTTVKSRRVQM
jgi:protein-S-isoprenylcysteine O-methyltransferase Ste14